MLCNNLNKQGTYVVLLCAVLFQALAGKYLIGYESPLMFCELEPHISGASGIVLSLMKVYFVVPFILLIFWGGAGNLISGYAVLEIVRNKSRYHIIGNAFSGAAVQLAMIVTAEVLIFFLIFHQAAGELKTEVWLQEIFRYYSGLLFVTIIMYFLELFTDMTVSFIIANLYFILSVVLPVLLNSGGKNRFIGLLFPAYYAFSNDAGKSNFYAASDFPMSDILYVIGLAFLISIVFCRIYIRSDII